MKYGLVRDSVITGYEEPMVCRKCRFALSVVRSGSEINCLVDGTRPTTMTLRGTPEDAAYMEWSRSHQVDPMGWCPRFERRPTWPPKT